MVETPTVSVIIRTHNEIRLVRTLLQNINTQNYDHFEVIVVDSESTDGTVAAAESLGAKVVHIRDEDFTFGYSLNVGCENATGEILVFISGHCYPAGQDWLTQLIMPYKDPNVGLVYGMQRGDHHTKYSESQIFHQYFWDSTGIIVSPTVFCNNANNSIRRDIWEQIPFDESFTGLEDLDMSIRAHQLGYYSVYNPKAKIIHVHDESWAQIRNRFRREAFAMKQMFPQRRMGFFQWINLFIRSTMADLVTSLSTGQLPLFQVISYRFNQYLGAYQGFKMKEEVNLPSRVEQEWTLREPVMKGIELSDKNQRFRKQSQLLFIILLISLGLNFFIPAISVNYTIIVLVWLWLWISFTEKPKETIELEDLQVSRLRLLHNQDSSK